jgi:hypothetical protein
MSYSEDSLTRVAQAEDTYDLLEHIAWTDVLRPKLIEARDQYSKALVNHLLGAPLQDGLTKEQLAGKIYGITFIISLIESILTRGERALADLKSIGISLQ